MAASIPQPIDLTDPVKVADWLELTALVASDGSVSSGDLMSLLRTSSALATSGTEEEDEIAAFVTEVFIELDARSNLLGDHYPFDVAAPFLKKKQPYHPAFNAYCFCLCLSYIKDDASYTNKENPRLLFEQLSALACKGYLAGEHFVFGTSRPPAPSSKPGPAFIQRLKELVIFLNENSQPRFTKARHKQDARIDLVVKKSFPDRRPYQLVVMGQCATGKNWKTKTRDVQPVNFWNNWLMPATASQLIPAFFVPHMIPDEEWEEHSRDAGLLFDRHRLAWWAASSAERSALDSQMAKWIGALLGRATLAAN